MGLAAADVLSRVSGPISRKALGVSQTLGWAVRQHESYEKYSIPSIGLKYTEPNAATPFFKDTMVHIPSAIPIVNTPPRHTHTSHPY